MASGRHGRMSTGAFLGLYLAAFGPAPACSISLTGSKVEPTLGGAQAQHVPVVTVETRRPAFYTVPGMGGRQYTNLGAKVSWQGLPTKPKVFKLWLREQAKRDPARIVVFADGGDVLYGGCRDEDLLDRYRSIVNASGLTGPVVAGAEFGMWPGNLARPGRYSYFFERRDRVMHASHMSNTSYADAAHCVPVGPLLHNPLLNNWTGCSSPVPLYQFVNSGFLMGPVAAMLELIEAMKDPINDQRDLAEYMFAHPDRVTLDYTGALVLSLHQLKASKALALEPGGIMRNRVTGTVQCYVHSNGPGQKDLRKLWASIVGK